MTRFRPIHKITSVMLISTVMFITVVGSYPVYASPCSHVRRGMPSQFHLQAIVGPMLIKMLRNKLHNKHDLDLSDDQYRRIEEEFHQFQQRADNIRQEFQVFQWSGRHQRVQRTQLPVDSTRATQQYMARLRFQELYIRHITAIFEILTPEQRGKLHKRGLTVLMISTLGAVLRKIASAQRAENLRPMQPAHIGGTAEHLPLPENMPGNPVYHNHCPFLPTHSLEHHDILRI